MEPVIGRAFARPGGFARPADSCAYPRYFTAPKRLSNEFDDTIGADPAT
jgi:hypothetical protein